MKHGAMSATARLGPIPCGLVLAALGLGVLGVGYGQEQAEKGEPVGVVKATIFLGEFE